MLPASKPANPNMRGKPRYHHPDHISIQSSSPREAISGSKARAEPVRGPQTAQEGAQVHKRRDNSECEAGSLIDHSKGPS